MEIKILCSCGSKYKFDVEPVDGRSPADLACPKCGASWTAMANAMIAQQLGVPPPTVAAAESAAPATASAPSAGPAGRVKLTIPGGTGHRVGIARPPAAEPPPAEGDAPAEEAPLEPAAPPPRKKRFSPKVATLDVVKEGGPDWGKFWLGVCGALIGAGIGALLYYLLFVAGIRNKLVALAVAAAAGGCARLLGRKGSNELGLLTAAFSLAAILGAQYFAARVWFFEADERFARELYQEMVADAKEMTGAIPNGTDEEIIAHLKKEYGDGDGLFADEDMEITADDVKDFRDEQLETYRRLANGQMTYDQWKKEWWDADDPGDAEEVAALEDDALAEEEERTFKFYFILLVMSKFNLACMAAAAGLAYKMTDI